MIDSLPLLPRAEAATKPLRFCVHDVFKPGVGTAGASVSLAGYMDAGTLCPGALDCCTFFHTRNDRKYVSVSYYIVQWSIHCGYLKC